MHKVFYLIIGLSLFACNTSKTANKTNTPVEEERLFSYDPDARVDKYFDSLYRSSTETTIDTMYMENDSLHMWVRYGGGCEHHHFELIGSMAVMKSYPPKRPIILYHQSEPDHCRALLKQKLVFNVDALVKGQEHSGIHLLMGDKSVFIPPVPLDPKSDD